MRSMPHRLWDLNSKLVISPEQRNPPKLFVIYHYKMLSLTKVSRQPLLVRDVLYLSYDNPPCFLGSEEFLRSHTANLSLTLGRNPRRQSFRDSWRSRPPILLLSFDANFLSEPDFHNLEHHVMSDELSPLHVHIVEHTASDGLVLEQPRREDASIGKLMTTLRYWHCMFSSGRPVADMMMISMIRRYNFTPTICIPWCRDPGEWCSPPAPLRMLPIVARAVNSPVLVLAAAAYLDLVAVRSVLHSDALVLQERCKCVWSYAANWRIRILNNAKDNPKLTMPASEVEIISWETSEAFLTSEGNLAEKKCSIAGEESSRLTPLPTNSLFLRLAARESSRPLRMHSATISEEIGDSSSSVKSSKKDLVLASKGDTSGNRSSVKKSKSQSLRQHPLKHLEKFRFERDKRHLMTRHACHTPYVKKLDGTPVVPSATNRLNLVMIQKPINIFKETSADPTYLHKAADYLAGLPGLRLEKQEKERATSSIYCVIPRYNMIGTQNIGTRYQGVYVRLSSTGLAKSLHFLYTAEFTHVS
uniref:SFRICE_011073 n=1 Tax=Spodoptera frugiperda TaxID=7108 RepID=A0A2H1WEZ4_SPOFR